MTMMTPYGVIGWERVKCNSPIHVHVLTIILAHSHQTEFVRPIMSSGVHGVLLRSVAMERLFFETTMAVAGGLSRLTHLHSRVYTSSALPPSPPSHRNESSEAHTPLLDFSNTEAAYRTKTFKEILRAFFVYHTFSFNTLVTHSQKVGVYKLMAKVDHTHTHTAPVVQTH